ncbi:hypothetical protein MMC22_000465 [Lobaria immixta]|nr:hypothetical protein [Lobaria immixta]
MIPRPERFEAVIVGGTRDLLVSAAKVGTVQALVYTSTSSVIHDNLTHIRDADETLPILRPPIQKRVYTLTKATAEEEIIAANRATGDNSMLTASLRPALTFGERDTVCLGKMFAVAEKGNSKYQMGSGQNEYDFVKHFTIKPFSLPPVEGDNDAQSGRVGVEGTKADLEF